MGVEVFADSLGSGEKAALKKVLVVDDDPAMRRLVAKILGRKRLREIGMLFAPDTILP